MNVVRCDRIGEVLDIIYNKKCRLAKETVKKILGDPKELESYVSDPKKKRKTGTNGASKMVCTQEVFSFWDQASRELKKEVIDAISQLKQVAAKYAKEING